MKPELATSILFGIVFYSIVLMVFVPVIAGRRHGWVAAFCWFIICAFWYSFVPAVCIPIVQNSFWMAGYAAAGGAAAAATNNALALVLISAAAVHVPLAIVFFADPPPREDRVRVRLALPLEPSGRARDDRVSD